MLVNCRCGRNDVAFVLNASITQPEHQCHPVFVFCHFRPRSSSAQQQAPTNVRQRQITRDIDVATGRRQYAVLGSLCNNREVAPENTPIGALLLLLFVSV